MRTLKLQKSIDLPKVLGKNHSEDWGCAPKLSDLKSNAFLTLSWEKSIMFILVTSLPKQNKTMYVALHTSCYMKQWQWKSPSLEMTIEWVCTVASFRFCNKTQELLKPLKILVQMSICLWDQILEGKQIPSPNSKDHQHNITIHSSSRY